MVQLGGGWFVDGWMNGCWRGVVFYTKSTLAEHRAVSEAVGELGRAHTRRSAVVR